ncbi:MAG TPA: hypothetical protein VJL29_00515, partial [Thermoguttaceae bacterium]|nr:hypothetical protein [Thermoguttaceae bacterium]
MQVADGINDTSPTTVDSYTYTTRTANGQMTYPVASQTHFEDASSVLTTYSYSWYDGRVQVKQQTITRPADGGGTVNIYKWYDSHGNLAWTKNESGTVNYYDYDWRNNQLERSIEDISQAKANALGIVSPFDTNNNNDDLPTDGVNATTEYLYDVHGRVIQTLGPIDGSTRPAAWTVYDDDAHTTYFVEGCAEETSTGSGIWTVFTLSNPVSISITNKDGNVTERIAAVLTKSGSSIVWSDNPSSAPADIALDAQSPLTVLPSLGLPSHTSYATWATYQYANKQLRGIHHYHFIPQTDGDQGTLGTNYTETQYGYNALGLPEWTKTPDGTITWNVLDARGLTLSTWIGTNDYNASDSDPSGGTVGQSGGNNMVKVVEYDYDKDGNLTSTQDPENAAKTNYSVAVSDMVYGERLVGDETDLTNWSLQISTYKEGSAWGL